MGQLHEIGCLQRMPWSVALLVALMVAVAAVGLPLYGCAMEIQALTQQEEFMGNLTQVRAHSPTVFGAAYHGDHCGKLWACVGSCGTISAARCWTRAT